MAKVKSQFVQRLALICFATSGVAFASSGPDSHDLLRDFNLSSVSGWALADFDGDSRTDVAAAQSSGHDARGFRQEVLVRLSATKHSSFTFSSRSARVRVRARDIDGDHDRDIVVLEALSSKLVGVWLNDGFGNFTEGDLSQFPGAGDTQRSISAPVLDSTPKVLTAILEERVQVAVERTLLLSPDSGVQLVGLNSSRCYAGATPSNLRDRAPPRNS
jgi:hypothetical protein